jgi:hypothetical protein
MQLNRTTRTTEKLEILRLFHGDREEHAIKTYTTATATVGAAPNTADSAVLITPAAGAVSGISVAVKDKQADHIKK